MCPIIINNFDRSSRILGDASTKFRELCIEVTCLRQTRIDGYVGQRFNRPITSSRCSRSQPRQPADRLRPTRC
jgi:hypothetical protein